jgi:hypothetical protein
LGWSILYGSGWNFYGTNDQAGYLNVCQKRLLSQRMIRYDLSDIVMVNVNALDVFGTRFYRVSLLLASGGEVTVTRTISTDWPQQQKMVRHIRGFLNTSMYKRDGVLLPTNPS